MDGIQNSQPGSGLPQEPMQPKFTPPPQPQINLRTPESDIRSIQRGDAMPTPESVFPKDDQNEPIFRPETQTGGTIVETEGGGGKKKTLISVIVGVLVVGLGAVGYFVVYPLLFPKTTETPIDTITPPRATTLPHQTLFVGLPGATTEVILPDFLQSTIIANFSNVSAFPQTAGTLQEVIFKDGSGNQVPFPNFMNAFAPTLTVDAIKGWFEDDFTAFIFYDADGAWPGFVGRIKTGVNMSDAETAFAGIEGIDAARFYITTPAPFDPWKDGAVNNHPTRYTRGALAGAALNYGFANNYFVLSTSYNGIKSAFSLLGI